MKFKLLFQKKVYNEFKLEKGNKKVIRGDDNNVMIKTT